MPESRVMDSAADPAKALDKTFDPAHFEERWYSLWEKEGRFQPGGSSGLAAVRHGHPAAQRHGAAAHRPRLRPHGRGHPGPLAADAGAPRAVAAGDRPRGHRDADGRRAPAREGWGPAARSRPREVHRARVGVAPRIRRHDPRPAAPARLLARLEPPALHDGRGSLARRAARVRAALPGRPDLPRPVRRELVPALRDGRVRSRGRVPRDGRRDLQDPLRRGRRRGRSGRRHDAPGDHARRHRASRSIPTTPGPRP